MKYSIEPQSNGKYCIKKGSFHVVESDLSYLDAFQLLTKLKT